MTSDITKNYNVGDIVIWHGGFIEYREDEYNIGIVMEIRGKNCKTKSDTSLIVQWLLVDWEFGKYGVSINDPNIEKL